MKQGIISIIVEEDGGLDIRFSGEDSFLLPLLGSLNVAGDFLKEKLLKQNTVLKKYEDGKTGKSDKTEYKETQLNKKDAMMFYLGVRDVLDKRLQVVASSNADANFIVNKDLFSNI